MRVKFLEDTWTIARKELMQHFKTKRLLVIAIIFTAILIILSVWGGYLVGRSQDNPTYEEGAREVLMIVLSFSSFFPAILAIALTYDAIVGERANNSMYLLVSKPINKMAIYFGKLFGAWLAIGLVYMVVMSLGFAIIVGLAGQAPSAGDVWDLYLVIGLIMLVVLAWLTLVMLLSTAFKTTASTLITAILMWLFVLNIVSQSGLIYYAVTAAEPDYQASTTIRYTPLGSAQSMVSFDGEKLGQNLSGYGIGLMDEWGSPGGVALPVAEVGSSSFLSFPGAYAWTATQKRNGSADMPAGNGTLLVIPDASMSVGIAMLDRGDFYTNDFVLTVRDLYGAPLVGTGTYEVSVNGTIVSSGDVQAAAVVVKNLTAGWNRVEFTFGNQTVVSMAVYSYGEIVTGNALLMMFAQGGSDVPGYVKVTYAISPDNNKNAYNQILDEEAEGILTVGESVAGLVAFIAACGSLGLVLFQRKDLT
jgi:ABC-type transport system involved in multi-copper enzyme maturation permease subunit